MTKYEIILYWSDEDQAFIAEVPEFAGCAADGATRQETLANAEMVIGEWLETAREQGRPIPEPKGDCSRLRLTWTAVFKTALGFSQASRGLS
jgi:predicted RNase H-like HicB family nuclease